MKTHTPDLAFTQALAAEDLSNYEIYLPSLVHTLRRMFNAGFALEQMRGGEAVLETVRVESSLPTPTREAEEGQPQFIGRILTNSLLPEVSDGGCQG